MVSCVTFKSLSHFEITFVHGMMMCSNCIDLHAAVQRPQCHLLKRLFPVLDSLICSIDPHDWFCTNTTLF